MTPLSALLKRVEEATGPRDARGRFLPTRCPECDCGDLRHEGAGIWRCDGLADPGHVNLPLEACTFTHFDGEPRAKITEQA